LSGAFTSGYSPNPATSLDQNQDIFNRLMENDEFNGVVLNVLMKEVYRRFNLATG